MQSKKDPAAFETIPSNLGCPPSDPIAEKLLNRPEYGERGWHGPLAELMPGPICKQLPMSKLDVQHPGQLAPDLSSDLAVCVFDSRFSSELEPLDPCFETCPLAPSVKADKLSCCAHDRPAEREYGTDILIPEVSVPYLYICLPICS